MKNRFGAPCYRCGHYCEAGTGHFEAIRITQRKDQRKWRVQHAECAKRYAGTDHQYDRPETWNRQGELPLCATNGSDDASSTSDGKNTKTHLVQQSTRSF